MHTTVHRRRAGALILIGSAGLLAACSSDVASAPGTSAVGSPDSATAPTGVLAGVCPATVVIQADWEPESEHGGIYALLGEDYVVDTEHKSVSGPLLAGGEPTGVDVEIRIGGSPVGYQPVQSLLYQDTDIMLGYGRVTEYMVSQADTPVTAVMATLEKSPYSIYWDPQTYPDAATIADLKDDGVTILMGSEATVWQDYLVGQGIIDVSQIDQSEAPKPASFIAAGGEVAEAGFASAEPYLYETSPEWGRPVALQLIHDTGYPEYFQALVARQEDITAQSDCLAALVPILQQAEVDYITDPSSTNALIVDLVEQYATGWVYTADQATWSIEKQKELGITGNNPTDGVLGSFDTERVQELIDIVEEYTDYDVSGLTPGDLVTNEFIDTSISLG